MRFKNRYYLVEIIWEAIGTSLNVSPTASSSSSASHSIHRVSDTSLQSHQLQSALRESMLSHFGEWGLSRVLQSLQVRYCNALTNLAIVRVARADSRTLAALVTFLTHLRTKQLLLRTIHLSGTIRSCQKRTIEIQKQRLAQLAATLPKEDATLTTALQGATSINPAQKRSSQQTLNQIASLLTQYNTIKNQQTAASSVSSSASSTTSSLTVQPSADAINAAITSIEQKSQEEIMAIDS